MDDDEILIALHEIEGLGWKTMDTLFARAPVGSLPDVDRATLRSWGIREAVAEQIVASFASGEATRVVQAYREKGIRAIPIWDPAYPDLLRHGLRPPWLLYAIGRTELLLQPSIAIVGTRTPTVYGKKAAYDLAKSLAATGFAIVSGLARGIDGEAHRGALDACEAGTIAVLGCGIDVVYPLEHRALYERIAADGLLLSEYPPGTSAKQGLFPQRNRIIAGLALGTLVVEAAERSGSLITSDMALEQGREVFALPGSIYSPKSAGTNWLLVQGAIPVTQPDDIVREYANRVRLPQKPARLQPSPSVLLPEERRLLELLSHEPTPIDTLAQRMETKFGHLHTILLSLLMKNMIEQLPGPAYVRKT